MLHEDPALRRCRDTQLGGDTATGPSRKREAGRKIPFRKHLLVIYLGYVLINSISILKRLQQHSARVEHRRTPPSLEHAFHLPPRWCAAQLTVASMRVEVVCLQRPTPLVSVSACLISL